ncbi:MAG: CPBP family intramembrane metalloprotease, partial [Candidatus Kapabacteria bacterium]|nr:CPBP family intramembrane metalloprotease [Candidatus Kapabacteria bacterium]
FRGILFQALLERFGIVISVSIGSVIFGLIHVVNESFTFFALLNIILAGVLLSMMYIRTRSLWLPISFHFFWNLGQATILNNYVSGIYFDIPVSTLNLYDLPVWLFGGYFGIEAGFITTFLLIVMIPILPKFTDVSPQMSAYYFKQRYEESKLREKKAA